MEPMVAEKLQKGATAPEDFMEESDVEVDDIDGHLTTVTGASVSSYEDIVPGASVSSYEDIDELDQGIESKGGPSRTEAEWRRQNPNNEHNKKERERRKILKEAVTQLRKQLRKPTRKPVTIKVLEAAQEEIEDLKVMEKSSLERLEAMKKHHSHLQWKLEELKKEVNKLPECDSVQPVPLQMSLASNSDTCNVGSFPKQPTAPQTPPSATLPAGYIIAPFNMAQPQHTPTLVNVPMAHSIPPSTSLLPPRLPIYPYSTPQLQTPFFPHFHATPSTQLNQQTSNPGLLSLTSAGSNAISHPLFFSSASGMVPNSYLIPPPPFLTQPFFRPSQTGLSSFVRQRVFPSLLVPDHLYQASPFSVPTMDAAGKETVFPIAPSLGIPLRKTSSAGSITSQSSTNIAPGSSTLLDRLHPNFSPLISTVAAAPHGQGTLELTGRREDGAHNMALRPSPPLHRQRSKSLEDTHSTADTIAVDSEEDKSSCSNVGPSLPDEEETDFSENYTWRRKKRRRKKRNREGCPSSSDSESEGSCSSSQRGRLRIERTRNSSSRSSASSSDTSRRSCNGGKSKSKKCQSFTVNKLCCVPPLLKVSAVELSCPVPVDPGTSSASMELISECEITVSANKSYVPSNACSRIPPCPTLDHLSGLTAKDSSNSSTKNSPQSSPPSSEEVSDVNWTEAIIEKSMNNLKRKFSECHSSYLDDGNEHSNYNHPTNTAYPILLNT